MFFFVFYLVGRIVFMIENGRSESRLTKSHEKVSNGNGPAANLWSNGSHRLQ
jgi:hypothetical protein